MPPTQTITIEIPTDALNLVAVQSGYQATIDGQPNLQTQADFIKAGWIRGLKRAYIDSRMAAETTVIDGTIATELASIVIR